MVDVCSSDNTAEIVRHFGDRVVLICQPQSGVSTARNTGVLAAAGNWIAFLDADDEWLPEKIHTQVDILARNPDLMWVGTNYYCQDDITQRRSLACNVRRTEMMLSGGDTIDYFHAYTNRIWANASNYLIKKEVLIEAGLFEPGLNLLEDMDLWWKIAYRYPIQGYTAQPLSYYHFITKPHGLTRARRPVELYTKILDRHFALSRSHQQAKGFSRIAAILLQAWLRRMLFENRPADVKTLLHRYGHLLSKRFKAVVGVLMVCPRCTARLCVLISTVVRWTGLRRNVVPRHPQTKPPRSD